MFMAAVINVSKFEMFPIGCIHTNIICAQQLLKCRQTCVEMNRSACSRATYSNLVRRSCDVYDQLNTTFYSSSCSTTPCGPRLIGPENNPDISVHVESG